MLLVVVCAVLMLHAPMRLEVEMLYHGTLKLHLTLRWLGLHRAWRLLLRRQGSAWQMVAAGQQQSDNEGTALNSSVFRSMLAAPHVRRYVLRHVRLNSCQGIVLLRTGDAALSALLSGSLRALSSALPPLRRQKLRLQIMPEFFRAHSTVHLQCICRFSLGILASTGCLLLWDTLLKQTAQHKED